jgi:hypothetical protein
MSDAGPAGTMTTITDALEQTTVGDPLPQSSVELHA